MRTITCEYDERRKTFNVFVDGEWYLETPYFEKASEAMADLAYEDATEGYYDDYEEPDEPDYYDE